MSVTVRKGRAVGQTTIAALGADLAQPGAYQEVHYWRGRSIGSGFHQELMDLQAVLRFAEFIDDTICQTDTARASAISMSAMLVSSSEAGR